jgi:hypothetical protein
MQLRGLLAVVTAAVGYRLITNDIERSLATTANKPMVARETEYYLANISKVKSISDFLGDDRIFKYAMKAFGLSDMDYAKAFMKKVLTEGVSDEDSFANKLTDKRYREFAETFNFAAHGDATTAFTRTQQGTVDRYIRQTLEEDAGQQNEGVRLALYFERKASSITSVYQLLGDKALAQFVQTTLGLPDAAMGGDIDRLAKTISDRIDIEDLQDPEKVQKLIQRFTTMWEIANPSTSAASSIPSLLIGQNQIGLDINLLTTLQQFRIGRN